MVHIKHVLCPVDFSELSRHAFDRAVAFARSSAPNLTVLHVLPVASAVPALPYGPGRTWAVRVRSRQSRSRARRK